MSSGSDDKSARLPAALRAALDLEQRGHDYYRETASRAENPLTRMVFSALADEELQHMKRISELYEHGGSAPMTSSIPGGSPESAVKRVFERFAEQERTAWELDNESAYEYAMELERQSYALYDRLANESENSAEAEFFRNLAGQENQHLTALENVLNYLRHTGDWFAAEESRVWNWMNM